MCKDLIINEKVFQKGYVNCFKVDVSYYLGASSYEKNTIYTKSKIDVISIINDLKKLNKWTTPDIALKMNVHPLLIEVFNVFLEEKGADFEFCFESNSFALSVNWIDEEANYHQVEIIN